MRLTRYFLPVLKENPAEAQIVSHRLMLRAGMIKQATAGIYSWLPLGFKVLRKIENIVHQEQQRAGQRAVPDVVGIFETKVRTERTAVSHKYEIARVMLKIAALKGTLVNGENI